jgi:hypothetical protein
MHTISGIPVHITHDMTRPRMQLPPDFPAPQEFLAEFNEWMRTFFGEITENVAKDGEVMEIGGTYYMNPRTYAALRKVIDRIAR